MNIWRLWTEERAFLWVTGGFNAFKSIFSASMGSDDIHWCVLPSKSLNERNKFLQFMSSLFYANVIAFACRTAIQFEFGPECVSDIVAKSLKTCTPSTWTRLFRFIPQPCDLFACSSMLMHIKLLVISLWLPNMTIHEHFSNICATLGHTCILVAPSGSGEFKERGKLNVIFSNANLIRDQCKETSLLISY